MTTLSESIPWESFRSLLEQGYAPERKSKADRKWIDPLILFKIQVLQQLFNLSDEDLEFQINDRQSFEEFIRLGVMNSIPDATTVVFLRERLRKDGVIEELFGCFRSTCEPKGWKPAVDRLSMPRLHLSPSREIPELRIKPSRKASCPGDWKTS